MNPRRESSFVVAIILLVMALICLAVYFGFFRKSDPALTAPAAGVMALATEQPSETPTPSPVPTIDTYPTYQLLEIDRMRAEADLQAINLQIAQTEQNIAQAKADEAAALASIADSEAKKAEQLRLITEAQNEQIKLKIELQRLENERTAIQNEQNAIIAIQAKADAQSGANWGLFVGGGLIAGAIVFAGLKISAMPPAEKPKNMEARSEDSTAPTNQVNLSPREAHHFETGIKAAEMAVLRRAALELGGRFSRPTMTPKYFTDPRWREIDDILCELRNRADTPDGWALATRRPNQPTFVTAEGWQWLGVKPPTAPPPEKPPETNQNAVDFQPTQPNQPTEVGE